LKQGGFTSRKIPINWEVLSNRPTFEALKLPSDVVEIRSRIKTTVGQHYRRVAVQKRQPAF